MKLKLSEAEHWNRFCKKEDLSSKMKILVIRTAAVLEKYTDKEWKGWNDFQNSYLSYLGPSSRRKTDEISKNLREIAKRILEDQKMALIRTPY